MYFTFVRSLLSAIVVYLLARQFTKNRKSCLYNLTFEPIPTTYSMLASVQVQEMMHLVSFLLCLHDHVGFPVSFSLSLSVVFLFLCLIFLVEPFSSVLSHHVIILSPFYFIFLCLFNSFSFVSISSSFSLYCVVLY